MKRLLPSKLRKNNKKEYSYSFLLFFRLLIGIFLQRYVKFLTRLIEFLLYRSFLFLTWKNAREGYEKLIYSTKWKIRYGYWSEEITDRLINVKHRYMFFTTSKELRKMFEKKRESRCLTSQYTSKAIIN